MKIENAHYTKEPSRPDGSEKVIGINCTIDGVSKAFTDINSFKCDSSGNLL